MAFLGCWANLAALRHSLGAWGYTTVVRLISSRAKMSSIGAMPHTGWRIYRSYLPSLCSHAQGCDRLVLEYLKLWFQLLWVSLLMKRWTSCKILDVGHHPHRPPGPENCLADVENQLASFVSQSLLLSSCTERPVGRLSNSMHFQLPPKASHEMGHEHSMYTDPSSCLSLHHVTVTLLFLFIDIFYESYQIVGGRHLQSQCLGTSPAFWY